MKKTLARKGRFFNTQDNQGAVPVTIINETMARRFWPGEEALGRRFKLGPVQSANPWLTIVGVVGDMRRQNLERQPIAQIFLPHLQSPSRRMNLLVRTTGEPSQLAPVVRNEIRSLDKTVPLYGISTLESRLAKDLAQRRFQTWLLTLFSALALTMILTQGLKLALLGVGLGLASVWALTRWMESLLFGVPPADPLTFAVIAAALLCVAMLACWIPARRATKVDPMAALRHD